jgi:hypothetical protein
MSSEANIRSALTPREFLDQMFGPELPRHLVAINESGVVEAATFDALNASGLDEWVAQHNGTETFTSE